MGRCFIMTQSTETKNYILLQVPVDGTVGRKFHLILPIHEVPLAASRQVESHLLQCENNPCQNLCLGAIVSAACIQEKQTGGNVSFTVKASFLQGLRRLPSFTFLLLLLVANASNRELLAVCSLEYLSNIPSNIVPHVPQRFPVSPCLTLCNQLVQSSQNRHTTLRSSRRKHCHHLHNLSYQKGNQKAPAFWQFGLK